MTKLENQLAKEKGPQLWSLPAELRALKFLTSADESVYMTIRMRGSSDW
jgi:hypothetical protein